MTSRVNTVSIPIVLAALNARYRHASFGIRYLRANLGPLRNQSVLMEFDLQESASGIVEAMLAVQPRIVGLGVYIWNVTLVQQVASILRQVAPDVTIVLGGPEISHQPETHPVTRHANYVITGEAELAFRDLCQAILADSPPVERTIHPPLPMLQGVRMPYDEYSDEDLANRILYVESSRGCPFRCAFCLSAPDPSVRRFPLPDVLTACQTLLDRGARQFKFVDRTFNASRFHASQLLQFFLEHARTTPGLFLHLEMVPDRLFPELQSQLAAFPANVLQLELGIQSFDPDVQRRIQRLQDNELLVANLAWLRTHTQAHLHTDLIAGLPGETLDSFADGFDRLYHCHPHEIQVGILKRLRGTPMADPTSGMAKAHAMRFNPEPPYELLANDCLDFVTMQRLKRFARYWDLLGNSGRFPHTLSLLLQHTPSPFRYFLQLSDWLQATVRTTHGIALHRLHQLLAQAATTLPGTPDLPGEQLQYALQRDDPARANPRATRQLRHHGLTPDRTPG